MPRRALDHVPLTKETLAAAYDYLASAPPISRWNVPDSEDIIFRIARSREYRGWWRTKNGRIEIAVSSSTNAHTISILQTIAHEIVHIYLDLTKQAPNGEHNAAFRHAWAQIAAVHGFDKKAL